MNNYNNHRERERYGNHIKVYDYYRFYCRSYIGTSDFGLLFSCRPDSHCHADERLIRIEIPRLFVPRCVERCF